MHNILKKKYFKALISITLLVFMVSFGLYLYFTGEKENRILLQENRLARGIVLDAKSTKRGYMIRYSFVVEGKTYKNGQITNLELMIGDSINIIYYPGDPGINRIEELHYKY